MRGFKSSGSLRVVVADIAGAARGKGVTSEKAMPALSLDVSNRDFELDKARECDDDGRRRRTHQSPTPMAEGADWIRSPSPGAVNGRGTILFRPAIRRFR